MNCRHRLARHVRRWIVWLCPERLDYRVSVTGRHFTLTNILTDEDTRMTTVLHDSDPGVLIALTPKKDRAGFTPPAGKVAWSCSDLAVLLIDPTPDGLSCKVKLASPVKLGWATITAKDTDHPLVPRKEFTFRVDPVELEDYDATITPLPVTLPEHTDPAPAGDGHQVVS